MIYLGNGIYEFRNGLKLSEEELKELIEEYKEYKESEKYKIKKQKTLFEEG
jgi:Sec-independent protein translocase protein TatA